jgi:hypothetical protein
MAYHIGLKVLRAKIRGFQSAGESIRHRIKKTKGLKRHTLWVEKRDLGSYNREHLIAYGLLKGVPYERIERCAENNGPDAKKVFELMLQHGSWEQVRSLTLEKVKTIISTGISSIECLKAPNVLQTTQSPEQTPQSTLERVIKTVQGLLKKGEDA